MAKKAKKGKEDRQGRHQEGGKKDFEEEVAVAFTIERSSLGLAPRTQSEISPLDLNGSLRPYGFAARQDKAGPLRR